ncbi:MAG TPA: hypothetical protein VK503_04570, partial [Candidatus Bathyarchaeia archaeon]|nr:hypothetical protein [Candidatus Bathyarchaeia archaeon]
MRKPLTLVRIAVLILMLGVPLVFAASPPTTNNLDSIVMLGRSSGWATGASGTVLYFDGSSWSSIPSGTNLDLMGLSFGPPSAVSSTSGFAVGGLGGLAAAIHWDGTAWTSITQGLSSPTAQKLSSVFEVSSTDAWAVDSASGAIFHWTGMSRLGGGWNLVSTATGGLNSIFMSSPTEGWAVGTGGIIYH